MKKCVMFALLSLAVLNVRAAVSNVYWKSWLILPTVYDFNTPDNWAYVNWATAYLPGTNDVANFLFWNSTTDMWVGRNWRLHFSDSITNNAAASRAPLHGQHATFDLDQKTWSLLNDYTLTTGRGGRIVLTNGALNVGRYLQLVLTTDLPEVRTNGIWVASDMEIVSSNLTVDGVHAILNGGPNPALNRVTHTGQLIVGAARTGIVSLCGGTYTNTSSTLWHYIGRDNSAYGRLEVSGGTNLIAAASGCSVVGGRLGRGDISVSGGLTVFKGALYLAYYAGSEFDLTVSGGKLDLTSLQVGREGQGSFSCTGGEVNMTSSLSVGTFTNGVGTVTVSGGAVETATDVAMGHTPGAVADLTLSGSGLLRCRRIYKVANDVTAHAGLLCDGGTLQASTTAQNVIDVLDEVCLTTNGLVLDTDGKNVSIRSVLQNQTGQAGSLTKKGAGTLTLAVARTATGPVSVLGGTLVASNALAVAEGLSTVNGTLTLTSGSLSIAAGAALAGTGTVAGVELAENAVLMRAKADGATTPLQADSLSTDGPLSIALTGYTVGDLKAVLPLIRTPSTLDVSQVTVTVDGETLPGVCAVARTDQGQNLLGVMYLSGTLISVF